MSDIRFRCPGCRGKLSVAAASASREVACPLCGRRITPWGNELLDIRFRCPACEAKLVVDRGAGGSEVTCPKCRVQIPVPDPAVQAAPPPPAALRDRTTERSAFLSWKPAPGGPPLTYIVYRGAGERPWEVKLEKRIEIPGTTTDFADLSLEPGTIYHYCVRSRVRTPDSTIESADSVRVRTQPRIVEEAVVSVLSSSSVDLTWSAPPGEDITGYHVERAPVEVWSEDELARVRRGAPALPEPAVGAIRRIGSFERVTEKPIPERRFTDTVDLAAPAKAGEKPVYERRFHDEQLKRDGAPYRYGVHAYRIRAVNALGVGSGPSPVFLTIPSVPQHLFSKEQGRACALKWRANPEKSLRGYHVYRIDGRWNSDTKHP